MGTVAGGGDDELTGLWHSVDDLTVDLPLADRRAVHDVIANSVLDGHHPSTAEIARLVAFAAGTISMADYLTHVTRTAHRERS